VCDFQLHLLVIRTIRLHTPSQMWQILLMHRGNIAKQLTAQNKH